MAYDVFVSYSRKDKEKAESLCAALEKAGISYWIDRNIHGSANFLSEITAYIKGCKVVVFVASANSANSEWTQKEILFALKRKKEIVPYRIGDFRFEDNDELDFVFTNVQWVESVQAVVESLKKLGVQSSGQSETEKTYKVGDYYDDGVKQGVVFEVTADGKHGKIVSLSQASLQWAVDIDFGGLFKSDNPSNNLIGAKDRRNGANNMSKVKQIDGWRVKYPAFAWCVDLGEGWYLPARKELLTIYHKKNIINKSLSDRGCRDLESCLSSTEYDRICAWYVDMNDGYTGSFSKSIYNSVRAVSAF